MKVNDLLKEVEGWKENEICKNDNVMKNMMLCMNTDKAQRSGEDYALDTPMLGRGNKVA